MENRETKIITTPLGKDLELKTFLTARERNQLRAVYMEGVNIGTDGQPVTGVGISYEQVEKSERVMINVSVVSYDNSAEKIQERLLDQEAKEYDFVMAEIAKLNSNLPTAK